MLFKREQDLGIYQIPLDDYLAAGWSYDDIEADALMRQQSMEKWTQYLSCLDNARYLPASKEYWLGIAEKRLSEIRAIRLLRRPV